MQRMLLNDYSPKRKSALGSSFFVYFPIRGTPSEIFKKISRPSSRGTIITDQSFATPPLEDGGVL